MINANELRIDNWVKRTNGEDYKVTPMTISDLDNKAIDVFPIPITEEWLLKFGFKDDHEEYEYFMELDGVRNNNDKIELEIATWENWNTIEVFVCDKWNRTNPFLIKKIKHVHELMNLYFSLTNEELEII